MIIVYQVSSLQTKKQVLKSKKIDQILYMLLELTCKIIGRLNRAGTGSIVI